MRVLLLPAVLYAMVVLIACGGSPSAAPQASPPPSTGGGGASEPDEEVVYVGSSSGQILAFSLNAADAAVRMLAGGTLSSPVARLRVSRDGRHLFAGTFSLPSFALQDGSVHHLALSESGEVGAEAQEVAGESADFELDPTGDRLFVHELFFVMTDTLEVTDSRSVISTYTLSFLNNRANASKASDLTIAQCTHYLCEVRFSLLHGAEAAGGAVLWAWDYGWARDYVLNDFMPLRIAADGSLSNPIPEGAVDEYFLEAVGASARWVVSSGEPSFGGSPYVFVNEFDGSKVSQRHERQGCRGSYNGEAPEHQACETVLTAIAIHPQRDLVFLADKARRIWSIALRPGSGMDLSTAKSVSAPANAKDFVVTPSGAFLFAISDEHLMGFRIAADGSLQGLSGSPWPVANATVLAAGNPDGR